MNIKSFEVFQGRDWFTTRWSVAQAFDTLERICELCQPPVWGAIPASATESSEILRALFTMWCDLSAEISSVEADLAFTTPNPLSQQWGLFEIRCYLFEIQKKLSPPPRTLSPLFDDILLLTTQIKNQLKHLEN